jgi:dTMP kinase
MLIPNSKFIVFEGIDGSGKSTVIQELSCRITSTDTLWRTQEPTNSCIGMLIREILSGRSYVNEQDKCLLYLFLADRIDHASSIWTLLSRDNTTVLSDRYYHSTFAYQSLKYDMKFIDGLYESLPVALPRPDLVIILNVSLKTAFDRIGNRKKELFETPDTLIKVQDNYLNLKKNSRYCSCDPIVVVDANRPLELVVDECWSLYKTLIKDK